MKKKSADYSAYMEESSLSRFKGFFKKRITLMLIPHSEKKVLNIQVSLFSIVAVIVLFAGLLFSFFILTSGYSGSLRVINDRDGRIERAEADLYATSRAVEDLNNSAQNFKKAINRTLSSVNISTGADGSSTGRDGDLGNLYDITSSDASSSSDVKKIDGVKNMLDDVIPKLNILAVQMESQEELFYDMPSISPLKGVKGRNTLSFGPQKNPFSGKWYIHRGLDLANSRGTPIVATANGKVSSVEYQPLGYGNYIMIGHKFSYNTRYAHLQKVFVKKGQYVKQGDVIGLMGSTGNSTGPHLHYEVRIGPTYVNPADYIGISYK